MIVLSQNEKPFKNLKYLKPISLSNLRISLNHQKYLNIKEKNIEITKFILNLIVKSYSSFYKKRNEKVYEINPLEILEYRIKGYFNNVFGNFELIKLYLLSEKIDKFIIFDENYHFFDFKYIKDQFKLTSMEVMQDKCLKFILNLLASFNAILYFLITIGSYIKKFFQKSSKYKKTNNQNLDVIFFTETKNQFNSIKPILFECKAAQDINVESSNFEYSCSPKQISKALTYIISDKKLITNYFSSKIVNRDLYPGLKIDKILEKYSKTYLLIFLVKIFNLYRFLNRILTLKNPKEIIITNDFLPSGRIAANFFNLQYKNTILIQHAALPVIKEINLSNYINYFILGGEQEKSYYKEKGISNSRLFVAGIPRYEFFYKNKVSNLEIVNDMFNNKKYIFAKNKFTILLTTNPIDDKSNQEIIESVIIALKKLNLIENLIIKLHPRENGIVHKDILEKLDVRPIIVRDYNILELIKSCNLLISQKSTTILEAMILGTPIILLNFINKDFSETSKYQFLSKDILLYADNKDEIIGHIKKITTDEDFRINYSKNLIKSSQNYSFYDFEEPPTKKIINFIRFLLNNDREMKKGKN
ncbi:MAG: hypothetical protein P8Y70_11465 [Candidatus Lokiarchaeota archaeon]